MNKVLDLFAGLGGFSAAFEDTEGWEVTTVEIDESFEPDICADVFDLRPTDFDDNYNVVLAGVPCTCFSTASLGYHFDGDDPTTDEARDSIALVHHTVGLISGLNPDWWFMENPRGRLRTLYKQPEGTVWYCQYGREFAKPTDLWGSHPPSFEYQTCSYQNSKCDHVKTTSYKENGGGSDKRQGVLTENDTAERARVPYELSASILEAVENPEPKQSSVDAFV